MSIRNGASVYSGDVRRFAEKVFSRVESAIETKVSDPGRSQGWIKMNNASYPYDEWKSDMLSWIERESVTRLRKAEEESGRPATRVVYSSGEATDGFEKRLRDTGIFARLALYVYVNIHSNMISMVTGRWGESPVASVSNMTAIPLGDGDDRMVLIPGGDDVLARLSGLSRGGDIFREISRKGADLGVDRFMVLDGNGGEYRKVEPPLSKPVGSRRRGRPERDLDIDTEDEFEEKQDIMRQVYAAIPRERLQKKGSTLDGYDDLDGPSL